MKEMLAHTLSLPPRLLPSFAGKTRISAWGEDTRALQEYGSGRRAQSQPITAITNPALISTVAAMKIAVSSGVIIQLLRTVLHLEAFDEVGPRHHPKTTTKAGICDTLLD